MSSPLTDKEKELIVKFGFKIEGTMVVHKKMKIEKNMEDISGFSSLEDLEDYIKNLLRSA